MRHRTLALVFFFLSLVLAAAAAVLAARTLGGAAQADTAAVPAYAAGADASSQPEAGGSPAPALTATPAPTATPKPTPTPEPTATPWPGPVVPQQEQAMGPEYFADAGFLGNSVTSGLWLYNNEGLLPTDGTTHWFCADSLTILGAAPYAAQMASYEFGKIYLGFGINEVNYNKGTLRSAFNTVIDQLQADHPDAIIYLMSVTPVSKWCDENREFKRSAVQSFNEMLQDIAKEQQVWYLDVYPVLCNEEGYLPSNVTPDGVHFSPAHYQYWFEYMQTHYVPDGHSQPLPPTEPPEETEEESG